MIDIQKACLNNWQLYLCELSFSRQIKRYCIIAIKPYPYLWITLKVSRSSFSLFDLGSTLGFILNSVLYFTIKLILLRTLCEDWGMKEEVFSLSSSLSFSQGKSKFAFTFKFLHNLLSSGSH